MIMIGLHENTVDDIKVKDHDLMRWYVLASYITGKDYEMFFRSFFKGMIAS